MSLRSGEVDLRLPSEVVECKWSQSGEHELGLRPTVQVTHWDQVLGDLRLGSATVSNWLIRAS